MPAEYDFVGVGVVVRGAAVWLETLRLEWRVREQLGYEASTSRILHLLVMNAQALVHLVNAGVENVPAAMSVGRSCFEAGLNAHWLLSAIEEEERERRLLGLQEEAAQWIRRVSRRAMSAGLPDASIRWAEGADRRSAFVSRLAESGASPIRRPDVATLCRDAGLERLYNSYQISSQFVHGGLMASEEFYGNPHRGSTWSPWDEDWFMPLSLTAWGLVFGGRTLWEHLLESDHELAPDPLNRLMWTINSAFDS